MTIKGLRHLSQLVENNSHIQRLAGEIEALEKNRRHLAELADELSSLLLRRAELKVKWSNEYACACEFASDLEVEREYARSHPREYYDYLRDQLASVTTPVLEEMLAHAKPAHVLLSGRLLPSSSVLPETHKDVLPEIFPQFHRLRRESNALRKSRTIWPSTAGDRVQDLEKLRARYQDDMRAVGTHTCMLTLETKRIRDEIAKLEAAMQAPPEELYREVNRDMSDHRLRVMGQILRSRKSPFLSNSALTLPSHLNRSRHTSTQPSTHTSFQGLSSHLSTRTLDSIGVTSDTSVSSISDDCKIQK